MFLRSFLAELRRRKVIQVAAIYGAVAWGVTEVAVTVTEQLFLPQWMSTLAVIGFVVGFPVTMFLAWTFDITSQGIQRTSVFSRRGKTSIVASMCLLVAGTAGVFFLVKPGLHSQVESTLPPSVAPNSVAVLPFEGLRLEEEDRYLVDVLSDELRDQLSRVPGLRVAARSSSIAVLEQASDARSVSDRLGVTMLVEGRLRPQGQKLNISVHLIDGRTGLSLWSESFDRDPREVLVLQQAITGPIVERVLPDADPYVAEPVSRDVSANELILLARHYEQIVRDKQEVDTEILDQAIRLYREATVADPNSALAQSRLAGALLFAGDVAAAEAPIFKALTLEPDHSEVQHTLGLYYYARGLPGAGAAFQRAVELNPNNPDALQNYARWNWVHGHPDKAVGLLRKSVDLDPLSLARHGLLGGFLSVEAAPIETLDVIARIESLFEGVEAYRQIADLYERIGEVDRAIAWTLRARDLEPVNPDHVGRLAELYAIIGDFDTALKLEPEPGIGLLYRMRRYEELIQFGEFLVIEEPRDVRVRYLLSVGYVATGQFDAAVRMLQSTGLPDTVLVEARSSGELQAFIMLMDAEHAAGNNPVARQLASFWMNRETATSIDWWRDTMRACALSVLGKHAAALDRFVWIRGSPRLAHAPILMDSACFQEYVDEPEYLETLRLLKARKQELRDRLPATLEEFDVSL